MSKYLSRTFTRAIIHASMTASAGTSEVTSVSPIVPVPTMLLAAVVGVTYDVDCFALKNDFNLKKLMPNVDKFVVYQIGMWNQVCP